MAHTPAQREIINSQKLSASWGESAKNGGMHIDFDEANAALVSGFTLGKIIRQERQ